MAAEPNPTGVDTSNPALRRGLRLSSMEDVLAEADRLAAAERAGCLKQVGNWTAGQAMGHLAAWINYCFDGYPLTAPEDLAALARARKDTALRNGLRAGFRIPGIPEGTAGTEPLPLDEGLGRLREAWMRLSGGMPAYPHPFFGALTREEWLLLHLRHAELHLSCLHPENP